MFIEKVECQCKGMYVRFLRLAHVVIQDVDELTAAMQELEWTTAMLDNLNNPSYDPKYKTHQEISENEELCISSDGEILLCKFYLFLVLHAVRQLAF